MESVKEILSSLSPDKNIPDQRILEVPSDELEELRRTLGVSSLENTFANFKRSKATDKAYTAFYNFTLPGAKPLLLCYGGVGSGKTHLLEAVSIELNQKGIFARVLRFFRILNLMKAGMKEDTRPTYDELLLTLCETKILLLDDVGAGSSDSKWAYTILEDIVVYRESELLQTAITTNKDTQELPERVVSRFRDPSKAVLILNEGKDYRRRADDVPPKS